MPCKRKVTDEKGGAIEVWETDETRHYDTQHSDRSHHDYRRRLRSDKNGNIWFKASRTVPYPIPHDGRPANYGTAELMFVGPVGNCWRSNRRPYPLSHMHCMVIMEVCDALITHCMLKVI